MSRAVLFVLAVAGVWALGWFHLIPPAGLWFFVAGFVAGALVAVAVVNDAMARSLPI